MLQSGRTSNNSIVKKKYYGRVGSGVYAHLLNDSASVKERTQTGRQL